VKTQRSADIVSGIFLSILGLVVVLASLKIAASPDVRLQPRTLPLSLGVLILGAGIILAARAWRFRGEDRGVRWPDRAGTARVLVTLASLAAYLVLMGPLGLPLSTLIFVSFLTWYLGRYRLVWVLSLGLASGAVVYVVFIRLLELSFPVGPLGR
jgi:putative tricarboxylic transport membrane protein